jgi:hypothetical protein
MNFTTLNTREENKNSSANYFMRAIWKFLLLLTNSIALTINRAGEQFVGGFNETGVNNRRPVFSLEPKFCDKSILNI